MSDNTAPVAAGNVLPPLNRPPITRTDLVRYQGSSGDMNPLHHDQQFAEHAGFDTVMAVGMLQAGILPTRPDNSKESRCLNRLVSWAVRMRAFPARAL